MNHTWKIYMLAFISFFVSTSEYVIAGILDRIAGWAHISVSAAGQLITVFAIANAIGAPIFVMATTKMDRRHLLMLSLAFGLATLFGSKLGGFMTDRIGIPRSAYGRHGFSCHRVGATLWCGPFNVGDHCAPYDLGFPGMVVRSGASV